MEKEFIPFDLAVKLKELGFEAECFGWYNYGSLVIYGQDNLLDSCAAGKDLNTPNAPLWQQAFDFMREKHNMLATVYSNASGYLWEYHDNEGGTSRKWSEYTGDCEMSGTFTTYYKARENCLEKLIEIVQRC